MKNSFIRLLLRDIKNYIRTNRFFLIAEAALFLIGCMIADMQKPDSYGKYTTIQYYMQIFRGCYPFTDARTEVFQVPLTWFTLMYFCIYTALLYPIRDASGAGVHVLLRAKSRALWWFSKCLALTVWNLLYFAVGFCSVYANDTPALNAHTALRGAPTSMGRGEIPVELMPSAVRFLPIYSSFMAAWNDSLCCRLKKGR